MRAGQLPVRDCAATPVLQQPPRGSEQWERAHMGVCLFWRYDHGTRPGKEHPKYKTLLAGRAFENETMHGHALRLQFYPDR